MIQEFINTPKAPKAIGPYSQAVKANGLVFTSGQLGVDPITGQFIGDNVKEQTKQIFHNLEAVLSQANSSLEKVIKTTVFLADMADFVDMNEIYASFFTKSLPARSAVQVARLPKDARVEIEVIALT